MKDTRILISNELESYREALLEVFCALYPDLLVFESAPSDLDRKVERLRPSMVICSRATALVKQSVPVWIELYLDYGPLSVVSVAGRRREVENIQIAELLGLVDDAKAMAPTY